MRWIFTFAGLGFALIAPFGMALARPPVGPIALVIAPPWIDFERAILAAGGTLIGPVQAPFARLAQSDGADFVPILLSKGIWAVVDGSAIAQLCGV
jgi:hypothetical protein